MVQIWLTYSELGEMYGRSAVEAREAAIEEGWDRRRCSDGQSRVKLPEGAAHAFILRYADVIVGGRPASHPVHLLQRQAEQFGEQLAASPAAAHVPQPPAVFDPHGDFAPMVRRRA
jgi:hypothetical protein